MLLAGVLLWISSWIRKQTITRIQNELKVSDPDPELIIPYSQHEYCRTHAKRETYIDTYYFYATLAYIRHFIFAGSYDNDPWYLVTNFAGHLDLAGHLELAGFYFSKCPAKFVIRYQVQAFIFILWWWKTQV